MQLKHEQKTMISRKKPNRSTYRRKPDTDDEDSLNKDPEVTSDDEQLDGLTTQEILELRKLRKKTGGVSVTQLAQGTKQAAKNEADDDPWKLKSGGGLIKPSNVKGETFGGNSSDALANRTGAFETASTAMDTSKHMNAFIDKELRKQQGLLDPSDSQLSETRNVGRLDVAPDDELFEIAQHLVTKKKEFKEDNVTLSTGMLTAIPEVDLGISNKLINIEKTERALKQLLESKNSKQNPIDDIGNDAMNNTRFMSSQRFWGSNRNQSDLPRHKQSDDNSNRRSDKRMLATDALAVDKFKKRMRR